VSFILKGIERDFSVLYYSGKYNGFILKGIESGYKLPPVHVLPRYGFHPQRN